jgi:type VI secretion system secreted protein Hcp
MAIYMDFEGIPGNVTDEGFTGQIRLSSCSWSCTRDYDMTVGSVSDRQSDHPTFGELHFEKVVDESTTPLFQSTFSSKTGKNIKISIVRGGGEKWLEFEFHGCFITNLVCDDSSSDGVESIDVSYSWIKSTYTPYGAGGKAGTPVPAGFDLKTARKV